MARVAGQALVDDQVVAEATLVMALERDGVDDPSDAPTSTRRAVIGAGTIDRPERDHRAARADRAPLQDRRVGGGRRLDRARRRQRGVPVGLDRPAAAGPQVRAASRPGSSSARRTCSASSSPSTAAPWAAAASRPSATATSSWPTPTSRTTATSATTRSSATRPRSAATSPCRTARRSARSRRCTSSAAIGRHAFIGGYSVVTKDALPYAKTVGNRPARNYGLNTIGLIRRRIPGRRHRQAQAGLSLPAHVEAEHHAGAAPRSSAIRRWPVPRSATWSTSSAPRRAAWSCGGR